MSNEIGDKNSKNAMTGKIANRTTHYIAFAFWKVKVKGLKSRPLQQYLLGGTYIFTPLL